MSQKRKKKKEVSKVVRLVALGGVLSLVQIGYLFYKGSNDRATHAKAAINLAAKSVKDPFKRELAKIRAAIQLYRVENKNKFPRKLSNLIPDFLDTIPINPNTGIEFVYSLEGSSYRILDVEDDSLNSTEAGSIVGIGAKDLGIDDIPDIRDLEVNYIYNPEGKRDPFTPFDYSKPVREGATPLERFSLKQLKLSSVLDLGSAGRKAMIETSEGRGYTVEVGSLIGDSGGEVVEITRKKVKILETYVDFSGEEHSRVKELKLGGSK